MLMAAHSRRTVSLAECVRPSLRLSQRWRPWFMKNCGLRCMILLLLALVSCAARRVVRPDAQEALPSSGSPQGVALEVGHWE